MTSLPSKQQVALAFGSDAPLTMSSREIADPKKLLLDVTIVLTSAFRDLIDAEDSNRQERCNRLAEADRLAMVCANMLREEHHFEAKVIQDLRMSIALASIGYSPGAIALSRSRDASSSKTYIALNPDSGLLKIGRSVNPGARMDALKTGAATKPELLLVIDKNIESALHKRFADLRVFGEWFRDDGRITAFIGDYKSRHISGCGEVAA